MEEKVVVRREEAEAAKEVLLEALAAVVATDNILQ